MSLAPGSRFGPYEILSVIGAGGMGEVYRARDARLHRDVALKVLPDLFANDPDRLARFQREAQVLASLNHPHIAGIYGVEDAAGVNALVLELVEGDDLSQRIARGPIPFDEALPIAKQIAEALEAAHEQGIIHRDLKPANVKVRHDGTVKVLDFGLAKAMEPAGASPSVSMSPTITSPAMMTGVGIILGTAAYMSPEQTRGKPVDKRADIWAFGCVLYEMLTGKRTFAGDDVTDVLAFIITKEPNWSALPASTPTQIRRLLRRCLQKDPKERLHDIADARTEISETPADWDDQPRLVSSLPGRSRERRAWMAAGVLGLTTLAGGIMTVMHVRESAPVAVPVAFTVDPPAGTTFITPLSVGLPWLAVSPDGRTLAFAALAADGRQQLWLRSLAGTVAWPLAATDDARAPFWSPDSRFVAFFAQGKLKYVEATGGTPQVLADAPNGRGGSWGRDNIILFNRAYPGGGIEQLSFGGNGVAVSVTRVDASKGERSHSWPEFLPDGRHFLFAVLLTNQTDTWIGSVDGDAPRFLFSSTANARYAPPGYLLYPAGGELMARRFNADTMRFAGDPFKVADAVIGQQPMGYAALSTSATGVLTYGTLPAFDPQLVWMDRGGRRVGAVVLPGAFDPALSPDGTVLAVTRTLPQTGTGIWLLDLKRDAAVRLTLDAAASVPVWSPDGKYVAFRSRKGDRLDMLYRRLANRSGPEDLLLGVEASQPTDWSAADGSFILFHSTFGDSGTGYDLSVLPLGDLKAKRLVSTPATEVQGVLSPNGQRLAYASDESGVMEVYVDSFPPTGEKTVVSRGGGAEPRWRSDGRELFYVSADRRLMAVAIPTQIAPRFQAGTPEPLFEMNIRDLTSPFGARRYESTPNGQRFLVVEQSTTRAGVPPITVSVNWLATLQK